jgi:subtilisin family serine protease
MSWKTKTPKIVPAAGLALLLAATPFAAQSDRYSNRRSPDSISDLKLPEPLQTRGTISQTLHESLIGARGRRQVIVRLRSDSLASLESGRTAGDAYARLARAGEIHAEQTGFIDRCVGAVPGTRVLARVQHVLNAVFLEVDAAALPRIARDPAVAQIRPVTNYRLDLAETVPYIGASAVQAAGFDGSGIRIAILDSGIDYTHAHFGGSGNPAEYASNDPTFLEPGTFPTAKIVGGTDFVGGLWDGSDTTPPLVPDPDPLDDGPGAGHGTHVADIAGGLGGVAPGADLYAVKVCSSVSTACSGVALIQGMEFAVDPDGDGDTSDHVDVVNMSLGADYGSPFNDDLSQAVDNATALGVLTVSSAGNGADKPYVQETPAGAPTAISVAQTNVPSAVLPFIELVSPPSIAGSYPAIFQPWSAPLLSLIEAPLQYGDGSGGNLDGCAPFDDGSLAGTIVLVDRGACNFTTKIFNIGNAGGLVGIIGLVAPGEPFEGGFADPGGPITIPGYMISQAISSAFKSGLPDVVARLDPASGIPLIMTMVGSSSRGPQIDNNSIKPEIGAPGGSVSAEAGTGTGVTPFGGTSGASPMVAGSAALLLQSRPNLTPLEVKALLMNTGEIEIANDAFGDPAPITRIGGGEVRVNLASSSATAAWDKSNPSGALSFGFVDVWRERVGLTRWVRIRNYSSQDIAFRISKSFRFPDDVANGAVHLYTPSFVKVDGHNDATFPVRLTIDGELLRGNFMNSGSAGADPTGLTLNEYDGYILLDPVQVGDDDDDHHGDHDGDDDDDDDDDDHHSDDHRRHRDKHHRHGHHSHKSNLTPQPIHLAWQVLPRKAARVRPETNTLVTGGFPEFIALDNKGVGTAQNDAYALIALSANIPAGGPGEQSPTPDLAAVGVNTFPVPPEFCEAEFVWAFAIHTHERQRHLIQPVSNQVWLDTNQDGVSDFVVLNRDVSFDNVTDGRQLAWAFDLATGDASAFFFAEHSMNTGNTVLYICGEQVGLTAADVLSTNVDAFVVAEDFYYGGPGDLVEGITITPLGEQFLGLAPDIAGNTFDFLQVYDFGPFPGNSPELGLLLLTNGDRGAGARGGATKDTEALVFKVPGLDLRQPGLRFTSKQRGAH